jgi:hypothetical protein
LYQWQISCNNKINFKRYYEEWLLKKWILSDLAAYLKISVPVLQREFDLIEVLRIFILPAPPQAITSMADVTFFGREYGFLVFSDGKKIFYSEEVKTESNIIFRRALITLKNAGYSFKSFTIDGRRGYKNSIRKSFGEFIHTKLRAAFRSLKTNLTSLFLYKEVYWDNIPSTINHLEGAFGNLKKLIRLHSGLRKDRKKKAIRFLLQFP